MRFIPVGLLGLFTAAAAVAAPPTEFAGTWTAPSLSRPATRITITLRADGRAEERIGDFVGKGRWRVEQDRVRIDWNSGWLGELGPDTGGRWRLLTWKPGSDPKGPPDDDQPAVRSP